MTDSARNVNDSSATGDDSANQTSDTPHSSNLFRAPPGMEASMLELDPETGRMMMPLQLPAWAYEAAQKFRIRTQGGRHADFDDEFDLSDRNAPEKSPWQGPFYFIQAADCQFGMIDSYVHKRTRPGWLEELHLCQQLVDLCHRMQPKPAFLVICGDLTDSLPSTSIGHHQMTDFKRIFAELQASIPLVCVCGNHDVGDEPTKDTVDDYRRNFGDDYFYFTKNNILFIVINSQFYQHRANVQDYAEAQDKWLEQILGKCKYFKYSIVFEHIPWFLNEPNEADDYFNIRSDVRRVWLEKFRKAGVTKIMCGHYHRNAGGWVGKMELVVTSAIGAQCGSDRSGVRLVKVLDKSIQHKYYAMQEVPLNVELKEEEEREGEEEENKDHVDDEEEEEF